MIRSFLWAGALAGAVLLAAAPAAAEPTEIDVRVLSKGAKFVGTSMGGARVILRNAATGEILAHGVTEGSTGSTERIMREALTRTESRATPGAAVWRATVDLDAPVKVRLEVSGPLAQPQAAVTVTSEMWVVPGRDVTGGDGWLVELPGMMVDVLSPPAHKVYLGGGDVRLDANVTLMCGCPITPGGLWDTADYDVVAHIYRDGEKLDEVPLSYAGSASQFAATVTTEDPGSYRAVVVAHSAADGNTGLDETTWIVR
jgi:hypothetical protein